MGYLGWQLYARRANNAPPRILPARWLPLVAVVAGIFRPVYRRWRHSVLTDAGGLFGYRQAAAQGLALP